MAEPHLDLDLDDLPPDVRSAFEAAIAGQGVAVSRAGRTLGSLRFLPAVLGGTVVAPPLPRADATPAPDGVTVVATAMTLSETARRRLSDEFGDDYIVVDFTKATPSADVLLVHPVSPQLLGMLRRQFAHAKVVITEIEDEELGVNYSGPVGRLLDSGASAYLPPRPIAELAATVHAYLTESAHPALKSTAQVRTGLPPTQQGQIGR
ncbi:hypothetical protein [Arthrobacter cupressi]